MAFSPPLLHVDRHGGAASRAGVQLALKALYCTQKQLVALLNVSPTQITKWKGDEELELTDTDAQNIEPCLIYLAASKIDVEPNFAPRFGEFKRRTTKDYVE